MAILLLKGTTLEVTPPQKPLNRLFLIVVGSLYLLFFHLPAGFDSGIGLERYTNLVTWSIVISLILIGVILIYRQGKIRYTKLTCGLCICCLLLSFPLVEPDTRWHSILPRISALWLGLGLFLMFQQFAFSNKHKQRMLWFIVYPH